ncbi:unnamed protein product [Caretta caretta]
MIWERDGQGAVSRQLRLLDHACSKWLPQQPREEKGWKALGERTRLIGPNVRPPIDRCGDLHAFFPDPAIPTCTTHLVLWLALFSEDLSNAFQTQSPMLFLPIFHKQNKNQIKRLISVCTELAAGRRCGGR